METANQYYSLTAQQKVLATQQKVLASQQKVLVSQQKVLVSQKYPKAKKCKNLQIKNSFLQMKEIL